MDIYFVLRFINYEILDYS